LVVLRLALEQALAIEQSGKPGKENTMMNLIKKLVTDESAQDLAEYGIALAVVAVGAGVIAASIGTDVKALWTSAQTAIHSAV
jgi:Flp pilus assembly pilin Flp